MHEQPTDSAAEVKRLRRCIDDLVSVLALPAVWSGSEPSRILDTFFDALLVMLDLDFLYARVRRPDSHEAPIEVLRTAQVNGTSHDREDIRHALSQWSEEAPQQSLAQVFRHLSEQETLAFPIRMGIGGELGLVVAGANRPGFPEQTEKLALCVAANQLAIGLQQALRLNEQKRVASELDRRVAERTRELAEANEALQLQVGLLQHLPVSTWTLKPDGTPDFVNQVWLEYSGQTLEFVRSHPEAWMAAVHPDDRESALRSFLDGVRSGQGFAIETRSLRAKDGTYRWHLQQAAPLRDAAGKVHKFVGTTTDIDDQKRAQEELRASETNLRQILDSIPGLVAVINPAGQNELANRQLTEYVNMTVEEMNAWGTNGLVHPDDLQRVTVEFTHSITTGTPYDSELRYRRGDGVYRWFQVRILPVRDTDGNITVWYALLTDIEDRKRAEDELRRSEASLAEGQRLNLTGSFSWYLDTNDFSCSEQYCRIFEFEPGSPVTLDRCASRIHPEDVHLLAEKVDLARRGISDHSYEIRLQMPDGAIKYIRTNAYGTQDRNGRLEFIGAIQDVTERRLSEEVLNKVRSELAHMTRAASLGALTASIAHEVNQPLSGIVTNASTCLRMLATDPPNVEGALETARRTIRDGKRAAEVITRLRALFAQKDAAIEVVDLNEATQEVIALSLSDLQRNLVILRTELADDLPPLTGDRIQIQQVILNLLLNAADAMSGIDDRPRQLMIRTERDEDDWVRLSVQDMGTGIDPQSLDKLFDAFYTTKSAGMGVGLSVSRTIIESHHGRLWATPNDGPGATFAFSIPCQQASGS